MNRLVSAIFEKVVPLALKHLHQRKDLVACGCFLRREFAMGRLQDLFITFRRLVIYEQESYLQAIVSKPDDVPLRSRKQIVGPFLVVGEGW